MKYVVAILIANYFILFIYFSVGCDDDQMQLQSASRLNNEAAAVTPPRMTTGALH